MDFKKNFLKMPEDLYVEGIQNDVALLKLFAYNYYFNADIIRTSDCTDGITYKRKDDFGVDGVFVNHNLDEEAIELLYSYWIDDNDQFDKNKVYKALSRLKDCLNEVYCRRFHNDNPSAELLIDGYLEECENKNIILRVVTNYDPDVIEATKIKDDLASYNVSIRGLKVSCDISFARDIEKEVCSNVAPFDYVEKDKLILDMPNNILKFNEYSFVCNISAKSLRELWAREGDRGLLAMNLRYYVKNAKIDSKIADSIYNKSENFWYFNNGIIIVCDDFKIDGNQLRLEKFSIVNGGQTSNMIGTRDFEKDFYLCCKVIKNIYDDQNEKNGFIADLAEATNTQKPIKSKDIIANKVEQRNIKSLLQDNGIFIEIKRGEKPNTTTYPEPWQRTKNQELAQDLYAFVFLEPGPARNNVSKILENDEKYDTIFVNHTYSVPFIRSLLFLEKAYREYKKKIEKDENVDAVTKGLVKNGMYYTLGTIGYILKLCYNNEYKNDILKYLNNKALYDLYASEQAFNHGFIKNGESYKDFVKKASEIFEFIFTNYLEVEFKLARDHNPSLGYSNWTKTNTGFNDVRLRISREIYNFKKEDILDFFRSKFVDPEQEQLDKNIDEYVDHIKANRLIRAKVGSDEGPVEIDKLLRDELMKFRLIYSNTKHIPQNKIFTDAALEKMVIGKPTNIEDLKKILNNPQTIYYCGVDILNLIIKTLS